MTFRISASQFSAAGKAALLRPRQGDCLLIGDSHSVANAGGVLGPGARLRRGLCLSDGRRLWALHLGPRLAFSIARAGIPTEVRVSRRFSSIVLVVGEIDVRTRPNDLQQETTDLIAEAIYTRLTEWMKTNAPSATGFVAAPIPPSSTPNLSKDFPSTGTLADRLDAHARLTGSLSTRIQEPLMLIDGTSALAGNSGQLLDRYSDDGCHLNRSGSAEWRRILEESI